MSESVRSWKCEIVGEKELLRKVEAVEKGLPNMMQLAVNAGAEVLRTAVVTNLTAQGLRKSGTLSRSIHVEPDV